MLPERIVCLTEETTEWLYLLGQSHRIVGISGYTVRPARARDEKPRISAFQSAKIDRIIGTSSTAAATVCAVNAVKRSRRDDADRNVTERERGGDLIDSAVAPPRHDEPGSACHGRTRQVARVPRPGGQQHGAIADPGVQPGVQRARDVLEVGLANPNMILHPPGAILGA